VIIRRPMMSEGAGRFYTALFSGLTVIGLAVGGWYSIRQYLETSKLDQIKANNEQSTLVLQNRAAQVEAKKPFLAKRLDACLEISAKAAALANADSAMKHAALEEFVQLSEGPLSIVGDEEVARRIAAFEECYRSTDCTKDLGALAVNLGHSCRLLISKDFDLNLSALPDRATEKSSAPPEQVLNRIVTYGISGSFQQGYSFAASSGVEVDSETGFVISANIQILNTGEIFTGAPVYNTQRMWQWQSQGSLGGSLDLQDQQNTFKHYRGGIVLTNSAYWTPSAGHNVNSSNTVMTPLPSR
jgi:hypothetical protein